MGDIIFITGGARSGKSSYAQREALTLTARPLYIATARVSADDAGFRQRVERHIADRDSRWTTIEEPLHPGRLSIDNSVAVIDCVTLWLDNLFSLFRYDVQQSLEAFKKEIDALLRMPPVFIIVSNELGMGVHAETAAARQFTDLQGWANQYIAGLAAKVVLMVSGIPVLIKDNT